MWARAVASQAHECSIIYLIVPPHARGVKCSPCLPCKCCVLHAVGGGCCLSTLRTAHYQLLLPPGGSVGAGPPFLAKGDLPPLALPRSPLGCNSRAGATGLLLPLSGGCPAPGAGVEVAGCRWLVAAGGGCVGDDVDVPAADVALPLCEPRHHTQSTPSSPSSSSSSSSSLTSSSPAAFKDANSPSTFASWESLRRCTSSSPSGCTAGCCSCCSPMVDEKRTTG